MVFLLPGRLACKYAPLILASICHTERNICRDLWSFLQRFTGGALYRFWLSISQSMLYSNSSLRMHMSTNHGMSYGVGRPGCPQEQSAYHHLTGSNFVQNCHSKKLIGFLPVGTIRRFPVEPALVATSIFSAGSGAFCKCTTFAQSCSNRKVFVLSGSFRMVSFAAAQA